MEGKNNKMNNCKHKITRNKNPIKDAFINASKVELIQIYNLRYCDSNDVFENNDIRGTYSQLKDYAKSYFKKRYWKDLDNDSDGENILFSIMENEYNTIYVECIPQGLEYSSYKTFVDLVHDSDFRESPKYINMEVIQ
jgi:hypothetical protein